MRISVTVPPAVEPVTLARVYEELRITPDGSPATHPDDAKLTRLIKEARENAETITRRALVQRTVAVTWCRFPSDRAVFGRRNTLWSEPASYDIEPTKIRLPLPPLAVVGNFTSLQYYDETNAQRTLSSTLYLVHPGDQPATVELKEGNFWPLTYLREDAVQATYVAGYAPDGSDYRANIPEQILGAIYQYIEARYDGMPFDLALASMAKVLTSSRIYRL